MAKYKVRIECEHDGYVFVRQLGGKRIGWSSEPYRSGGDLSDPMSNRTAKFVDAHDASEWCYYNNLEVVDTGYAQTRHTHAHPVFLSCWCSDRLEFSDENRR